MEPQARTKRRPTNIFTGVRVSTRAMTCNTRRSMTKNRRMGQERIDREAALIGNERSCSWVAIITEPYRIEQLCMSPEDISTRTFRQCLPAASAPTTLNNTLRANSHIIAHSFRQPPRTASVQSPTSHTFLRRINRASPPVRCIRRYMEGNRMHQRPKAMLLPHNHTSRANPLLPRNVR